MILVTDSSKTCDGCLFLPEFSSLPPLWVPGSSSMGPLFLLEIRGSIEVAIRQQRGFKEAGDEARLEFVAEMVRKTQGKVRRVFIYGIMKNEGCCQYEMKVIHVSTMCHPCVLHWRTPRLVHG